MLQKEWYEVVRSYYCFKSQGSQLSEISQGTPQSFCLLCCCAVHPQGKFCSLPRCTVLSGNADILPRLEQSQCVQKGGLLAIVH
jgi:hypothetical protein